jgi:hypothetical protein
MPATTCGKTRGYTRRECRPVVVDSARAPPDASGGLILIQGWDALWARDLPRLRALGANTIRVYSTISRQLNTDGTFPAARDSSSRTRTSSMPAGKKGRPIYVLAGIPLPAPMYVTTVRAAMPV